MSNTVGSSSNPQDWFTAAFRYTTAARVLVESPDYARLGRILLMPALMLISQSVELLLKGNLIVQGRSVKEAEGFGHDLAKLWNADENEPVRGNAYAAAARLYAEAADSSRWQDDFSDDPLVLIEEYVARLAELHGKETKYALRYPSSQTELMAPRLPFLAYTFLDVSEVATRNPSILRRDSRMSH